MGLLDDIHTPCEGGRKRKRKRKLFPGFKTTIRNGLVWRDLVTVMIPQLGRRIDRRYSVFVFSLGNWAAQGGNEQRGLMFLFFCTRYTQA